MRRANYSRWTTLPGVAPAIGLVLTALLCLAPKCAAARPAAGSALIEAVKSGRCEDLETLLRHGANINTRDADARTPLIWAAQQSDPHAARILLSHGARPNLQDSHGWPALWVATERADMANCTGQEVDVVRLLLAHGATVNFRDRHGESIFGLVAGMERPNPTITRMLVLVRAKLSRAKRRTLPLPRFRRYRFISRASSGTLSPQADVATDASDAQRQRDFSPFYYLGHLETGPHLQGAGTPVLRRDAVRIISRLYGYGNDRVYPEVKRDAFLAAVAPQTFVVPAEHNGVMKDVGDWSSYVFYAALESGIFTPDSPEYFGSAQPLSRGELAVVLCRLLRRSPNPVQFDLARSNFRDASGREWWYGGALVASGAQLIDGCPDHSFRGDRPVTRAEFVIVMNRFLRIVPRRAPTES